MIKIVIRSRENEILVETNSLFNLLSYIVGLNENGGRLLDIRVYSGSVKIYHQSFNSLYVKEKEGLGVFLEDVAGAVFPHSSDAISELKKELEALR